MKKFFTLLFLVPILLAQAQNFTPGNLVVTRVGDGSATLSSTATTRVGLLEYTKTGANQLSPVTSLDLNRTGADKITVYGSVNNSGQVTLSADGRFLTLVGYDQLEATNNTTANAGTKVIVRVDNTRTANYATKYTSTVSAFSSVTDNGTNFWTNGTLAVNSMAYGTFTTGTSALTSIESNGPSRVAAIYNNQLYALRGFDNIFAYGTGLPTSAASRTTAVDLSASLSSSGFVFFDLDPTVSWNNTGFDVVYCSNTTSGLEKYYWNGNDWKAANSQHYYVPTITDGGTGYTTAPTVTIGRGEWTASTTYAVNDYVVVTTSGTRRSYIVTQAGTSDATRPTVTSGTSTINGVTYSAVGTSAITGTAVITGGVVTDVIVTHGHQPTGGVIPPISFSGGGGSGATATTAFLNNAYSGTGSLTLNQLTGEINAAGNPVIYGVTGTNGTTSNNTIVAITDASGAYNATMRANVPVNTTFITLATAGANFAFRGIALAPRANAYTWSGSKNTTYSNPSNWFAYNTPPSTASIYIPSGLTNYPNVTNATSILDATLEPGANLRVNASLTNSGVITLQSNENNTASIGNSNGSISGDITIQRFIKGGVGRRRFRFLSHPFKTDQNLNIITGIDYTGGNGTNGFTSTPTNNPSVFWFDNSSADANATNDAGWKAFTVANTNIGVNSFKVGQGIRLFVRGALGQGLDGNSYIPADATISMTGSVNMGNVNVPLSFTSAIDNKDLNLVGNPYPSSVNIGAIINASSLVDNKTIFLRNPTTNAYITVDVSSGNYILNSSSAFFVRAASAGNLVFSESNKENNESGDVVFSGTENKNTFIELQAQINGDVFDNYLLKFDNTYKLGYDKKFDSKKIQNDFVNIYSKADNEILSLDTRNFNEQTEIPLGINISSGKQSITLKNTQNYLANNMEVILWDKLANIKTKLEKDATYTFEVDKLNEQTLGENRLVLLLSSKTIATPDILSAASVFSAELVGSNLVGNNGLQLKIQNPKKQMVQARVVNTLGQLVSTTQASKLELQNVNISTNLLQPGKYFIEVVCGVEKQILSVIKN